MQRWAFILSWYCYDIQYHSTHAHTNTDGLSRLPLPDTRPEGNPGDAAAFTIGQLEALPVQASKVEAATPILNKVVKYLRQGWQKVREVFMPYWRRREELSLEGDYLFWGIRVVIPKALRQRVLTELHHGNPGIVKVTGEHSD